MSGTSIQFDLTRRGRRDKADVGLGAFADDLTKGLAIAGSKMPAIMRAYLTEVVNKLAAKHGGTWPGGTGTDSLSRRSGTLLASLKAGIAVTGTSINDLRGSVGGAEYLTLHEYGGTVTPHGSRYLAIPLPAALNSNGTPIRDSPADWDNTFTQMSRRGNLLIFRKEGSGIVPLYALKTSLTIPARFGARQLARETMPYFRSRVLDSVLLNLTVRR